MSSIKRAVTGRRIRWRHIAAQQAVGTWVLTVIFVIQNRSTVSIDLLWLSVRSPQWLTISVIFLIGWLCGYFTRRRKNSKE